ncbi:hypothetical protein E3_0350 [Rhodococcus phage E3]|uniref:hypothetical protein n=1 Tax=Rhodococcus phage E3 TaxID=1007869 RepID=UPI0002C699FE|nr:hypothetical protein M176_gp036 [Rhodococcus phage E3]AEQ20946.1 hypothetical protein E3_0350 [Rhodococcus phage E3]
MSDTTNTYVQAAAALIECHDCSCHIDPPCEQCVECKECNPCWTCDEVHNGPRDDECPTEAK